VPANNPTPAERKKGTTCAYGRTVPDARGLAKFISQNRYDSGCLGEQNTVPIWPDAVILGQCLGHFFRQIGTFFSGHPERFGTFFPYKKIPRCAQDSCRTKVDVIDSNKSHRCARETLSRLRTKNVPIWWYAAASLPAYLQHLADPRLDHTLSHKMFKKGKGGAGSPRPSSASRQRQLQLAWLCARRESVSGAVSGRRLLEKCRQITRPPRRRRRALPAHTVELFPMREAWPNSSVKTATTAGVLENRERRRSTGGCGGLRKAIGNAGTHTESVWRTQPTLVPAVPIRERAPDCRCAYL
jgi:hypothetical protein